MCAVHVCVVHAAGSNGASARRVRAQVEATMRSQRYRNSNSGSAYASVRTKVP